MVRAERKQLLERVASGELNLSGFLTEAVFDESAGGIKMSAVLTALGWSSAQFVTATTELELQIERRVRWWLTRPNDLDRLRGVDDETTRRPATPQRWPFHTGGQS